MSILLGILTFILILISLFLVLVVLMQKSKDGGVGAALGGGATEAAFGADTTNVLSKSTIYAAVLFFVLAFALYLGRIYEHRHSGTAGGNALPSISVPAAPATAPATTPAGSTAPAVTVPTTTPTVEAPAPAAPVTPAPTTPAPESKK